MKRALFILAIVPLALWGIFALPEVLASNPANFWDWRKPLTILSGLLALWWMSAGMLLATRPRWLEQRFGGLDKLYRLHRNIGIGAGILVFVHWMIEWLPKKLSRIGWIVGPERPRGPRGEPEPWIHLAKEVGEWAGYILLALVVVALLRRIPYRYFRLVHKAFGLVFLAGTFHGLILMPASFWTTPLAWLTTALAVAGCVAALLSLSDRIGRQRQHTATIEAVKQQDDRILEVVCRPQATWPGHRAGQFLLADFGAKAEGHHPFTIASAWNPAVGTLTLAIKALGDFTSTLPEQLQAGQTMRVEGPYGHFDFGNTDSHQIWVAGGIGITPFLARLQDLAANGQKANVDFFYSTVSEQAFPDQLATLCRDTGIRLHRRLSQRDGPITPQEINACRSPGSSVWFCGPSGWGKALSEKLRALGLPRQAFHQEAFEFR